MSRRPRARASSRRSARPPLLLVLALIGAAAMGVPAIHAMAVGDWATARAFGYSGLLFLTLGALIGIALANLRIERPVRSHLVSLLAAYAVLPLMLAVPVVEATRIPYLAAYAEMVSSFTTTGLSYYEPSLLLASIHLWRGLVAWLGGLLIWVAAASILAPLNLGGFEVGAPAGPGRGAMRVERAGEPDPADRVLRFAGDLVPLYTGLTIALWVALMAAGDRPFVAFCHAMATLSTSGISPLGGIEGARSGVAGEAVIALALVLALSRFTFLPGAAGRLRRLIGDAEMRVAGAMVLATAAFLFARHLLGAIEQRDVANLPAAAAALWGGFFTALGFLTTAGFESAHWQGARAWSGREAPEPILIGLAVIGGGVATTAGGIKLFRIYALVRHGARDLERLSFPSSVGGSGRRARRIRREGARIAFVFVMLFVLAFGVTALALAATGIRFEGALTLALAALTNTGPLAQAAAAEPIPPRDLGPAARLVLSLAMVLGRLEVLAIVALLNPNLWRA